MSFEFTEEHLVLLWDLNQFQVPRDRWVFFGLRGCLPVSDQDHSFARSHAVKIEGVDYLHPRCTLGQWQPGRGARFRIALTSRPRAPKAVRGRTSS